MPFPHPLDPILHAVQIEREGTYEHLNAMVPDELKYALHVLLVEHGKVHKNSATELRRMAGAAAAAVGEASRREAVPESAAKAEAPVKVKVEGE